MMSIYQKRPAVSPIDQRMLKSATIPPPVPPPNPVVDSLVTVEINSINGKPFYGEVSEDEVLYIWIQVFKKQKDDLFGFTTSRSLDRHQRIGFKLNKPTSPDEVFPEAIFSFERYLDDGLCEVISGRILSHGIPKPAEIGQLTKVTAKTNFKVDIPHVLAWLRKFGNVSYTARFIPNSVGLNTDVIETEITLQDHIPEYLPIYGQKVLINYPGIPKVCNNCYKTGHLKRNCKSVRVSWLEHVEFMLNSGTFEAELFGSWSDLIRANNASKL